MKKIIKITKYIKVEFINEVPKKNIYFDKEEIDYLTDLSIKHATHSMYDEDKLIKESIEKYKDINSKL